MKSNQWHTLAASTCLEYIAGLGFSFSLYAPFLKHTLQLSQPQLQGIGTATLSGGLMAILPGVVYDRLHSWPRLGPRMVALVGVICHLLGYTVLWASVRGIITPSYPALIINGLVLCNGPSWTDTLSNVVSIQNFPGHRGPVSGLLKGFHGISASVTASVFAGFFAGNMASFLLFLALGPSLLGLIALVFLDRIPNYRPAMLEKSGKGINTKFLCLIGALLALYMYQMLSAILADSLTLGPLAQPSLVVGAVIFLAAIVLGTAWPVHDAGLCQEHLLHREEVDEAIQPMLMAEGQSPEQGSSESSEVPIASPSSKWRSPDLDSRDDPRQDTTLSEAVTSLNFWLLFYVLLVGMGFGITVSNNLGLQVLSLGGSQRLQALAVLVCSTAHGFGCLVMGPASEFVVQRLRIGRTAVLVALAMGTSILCLCLALCTLRLLLPCVALAGFVSGGFWPLFPSCTADLFGTRHFAAIRGLLHVSSPLGTALLSIGLAGRLYEREMHHQLSREPSPPDKPDLCLGSGCFREAYLLMAGIAGAQALASFWLYCRTKKAQAQGPQPPNCS